MTAQIYTAKQLAKLTAVNREQARANESFFNSVLKSLNEGGIYTYPAISTSFKKQNNTFVQL